MKYSLSTLTDFKCLATDCPDDCCHGWNLHIDAQTLVKWKSIDNKSLKAELLDSVSIINENDRATEVVQQQSDGSCVFLSEQGLCTIQQRCSHDFLPETCREYPRVCISNSETQLYSAHLSCPGIIQLLAKQKSTSNLFSSEISDNNNTLQQHSESTQIGVLLGTTILQVMSETRLALALRLYFIATLLNQLATKSQHAFENKRVSKICRISEKSLHQQFSNLQKQIQQNKLKINKKMAGIYWQLVFHFCRAFDDAKLKSRIEHSATYQMLLKLNQPNQKLSDQDYLKHYQLINKLQAGIPKKLTNEIDAILTPVMQVKFKNHGFPWYLYKNSLELTYLDCVIPYSQMNLILWMIYENTQKITEQDIITVIYKVEKTVAHNTLILEQLEHQPELLQIASYSACWLSG